MDVSSYPAPKNSGRGSTMSLPDSIAHLMSRPERYMGEFSIPHEGLVGDLIDVIVRQVYARRPGGLPLIKQEPDHVPIHLFVPGQQGGERLLFQVEAVAPGG